MSSRRVDVFFYGLFMDAELLVRKGLQPGRPRGARLDDFALVIGRRATLVPRPGARVHGVVMDLTQVELSRLYAEASVADYRPEAVLLWLTDGTPTAALCYNLEAVGAEIEADRDYAAKLADLARRLDLPRDYQAAIRATAG